jgi:2-polyprenyl-6-methoxyphenol hydroxylase-like FAD-dependent oxidoreductase
VPLDRHVELHTIRHGYCGMVEIADGVTNLCCWVEAEVLRRAGGTPKRFLDSVVRENAHLYSRLRDLERVDVPWTTTSFAYGKTVAPVVSEIWNIGDCAAMVAPLTGDGMAMGLRAAELAAIMMLEAFRQESLWNRVMAEYAHRWQQEFLPRLRWGRRLEALLLQPRLASLACGALQRMPRLMPQLYHRTRQLVPTTAPAADTPSQRPLSRRRMNA